MIDFKDGGWRSRKFCFGVMTSLLIFAGWLASSRWVGLQANFIAMAGALTGIFTLFLGANIGAKAVDGNNAIKIQSPTTPE